MGRPTEDDVYSLLDGLYEVVLGELNWQVPLERLSAITDAHVAMLFSPPSRRGPPQIFAALGTSEESENAYADYYAEKDVWFFEATRQQKLYAGSVFVSEELVSPEDLRLTEWRNDFLSPLNIEHHLVATISSEQSPFFPPVLLSQYATEAHGAFDEDYRRFVSFLLPHLQRVVRIRHLLHDGGETRRAFDLVDKPVLMIDARGCIAFMNDAARLLLQADDGLTTAGTRLVATLHSATQELERAIAAAVQPPGRPAAVDEPLSVAVPRPSGRRNYVVDIAPLRPDARHSLADVGGGTASALAVIHDLDATEMVDEERLRRSLGLTGREAFLLKCVAEEMSVDDIAAAASLTRETVRTYLKRLLAKTGCRNQAALVKLAFGLLPKLRS